MIQVKNLDFSYPGASTQALSQLNFEIQKGDIFGFLGPSGSGKSTTQKILYRWLKGYSGEIKIGGKLLEAWDNSYYERIGVSFELPNHYEKLTGLENLQFFGGFYSKKVDAMYWLKKVGLENAAKKPVSDYSKGMRMRLNFIRALIHDPDILFLDEPTSGLDPGYAAILKDIILECKAAGKTIFLTTHNMQDANELCDQVAFLTEGKIQALDSPDNFRHQYGKAIVKLEVRGASGLESFEFEQSGLANNPDFLAALEKPMVSLHSGEASLEDVFIQVTGKQLKID